MTVSFILSAVAGLLTRRHYLIKFFGNGGIMIVEGVGWVPMAQKFSERFYKSKAWRACRSAYIDERIGIDGGLCECCHDVTGYEVHHKIKLTPENINDPEVTLDFENLKYLCDSCHKKEHIADAYGLGYVFINGVPSPHSK